MKIELRNTGSSYKMKGYYQKLIEAGWDADVSKETRTIKYYISTCIEPTFIFDLSEVLGRELIAYVEDGQYVIEIYDDWRE